MDKFRTIDSEVSSFVDNPVRNFCKQTLRKGHRKYIFYFDMMHATEFVFSPLQSLAQTYFSYAPYTINNTCMNEGMIEGMNV